MISNELVSVVTAEVVCAIVLSATLATQIATHSKVKSSKQLIICTVLALFWLAIDATTYLTNFSYVPMLLTYLMASIELCAFAFYCENYIKERTPVNPWAFRLLKILCVIWAVAIVIAFVGGKIVRYENGEAVEILGYPMPLQMLMILVAVYVPAIAISKKTYIGWRGLLIFAFFTLATFFGTMIDFWTGNDYSVAFCALMIVLIFMILQQSQIRESIEREAQLAEAANKSKTSFLFNMSHDIRTPMNAIRGFTAMAKTYADDKEKVVEYLDKIDISGQQLLTLINQVLEMARIESGKIEFEDNPIDVSEEFNSMVTVLSEQAKSNGLEFKYELGNVEHNFIFADEARMGSITLNIAGNAVKYTPEGGTIEFDLKEIESRKPGFATFVFTVADTGIGMSKEYLEQLYEPFTRENNSTVSKIQGTGLGMSIVKNTVDLLGGNIEVQSELGKGTRFDITIDFRINENPVMQEADNEVITPSHFKDRRILLVEDNEMNREIARYLLEDNGIIVEDANDGDVAVGMIREIINRGEPDYYDLILMDVQMPRMNGYEATKEIRQILDGSKLHVPIIAMTANAFKEDRQNALAAGMDEHLAKPIDVRKMYKVIAKFI